MRMPAGWPPVGVEGAGSAETGAELGVGLGDWASDAEGSGPSDEDAGGSEGAREGEPLWLGSGSSVPAGVLSLPGLLLARALGLHGWVGYDMGPAAELSVVSLGQTAALGIICALAAILFCVAMHQGHRLFAKIRNAFLRAAVGGALALALTLLVGSQMYSGAGDALIRNLLAGETIPYAFLLKILFTAITLGAGFRGGEIVPALCVGCALGTWIGPILGLPHGFAGALGMAAVFCGVTNCPITATILSFELFGGESLTLFAVCCAVSYMLSGYYSLYSEQKIVHSKFRAEWIDRKTH